MRVKSALFNPSDAAVPKFRFNTGLVVDGGKSRRDG